jgi:cation diffusion facilitator CzcD-associated flavoprotein CzcO
MLVVLNLVFATLGLEVVIVGAGLGGAALATYLRLGWLGPDTDLTMSVFEAGDEAGGAHGSPYRPQERPHF